MGGATAAVGGLIALTNKTAESADEIDKMAERTGIGRERLQELRYAAGQSDVEFSVLEKAVKKMSETTVSAAEGNKKASAAFEELGLSLHNADGSLKSTNQLFEESMNALADMEEGVKRNTLGNQLFGKGYTEMLPLLNAGSTGIKELTDRSRELGLVMSEDAVKANVTFGDTLSDLKQSFGALTRDLTNGMLPMLQGFIDFILENMPMIQDTVGGVFKALAGAVMGVLPFLMDLITNTLPPMIDLFTDIATNILPPVITLFTDILQAILPPFIEILDYITGVSLNTFIAIIQIIVENILPPLIELFKNLLDKILPPLMSIIELFGERVLADLIYIIEILINTILPPLLELFTMFTEVVLPPLMELIDEIVATILPPLLDIFTELAETVLPLVMTVFEALLPVIEPIMRGIAAVIKTVLALIKGDWEGAWNGIKEFFQAYLDYIITIVEGFKKVFIAVFEGISKGVMAVWDGLVNGIKGAINFIIGGINAFIRGLNKIKLPDWVPGVGGKGISIGEIPMLADGGVIEKSGRVLVGERGPEFLDLPTGAKVTPLDKDIDYKRMAAEIGESVYNALIDAFMAARKQNINLEIAGNSFARIILPFLLAEYERLGVVDT